MCNCKRFALEELHPRNFLFDYLYPEDFIRFQCIQSVFTYILWRSVWAICFIFMLILNGTISDYWTPPNYIHYQWFTYLTHWTSFLLAFVSTMDAICVIQIYLHRPDIVKGEFRQMPWYVKINWLCTTINSNLVLLVTLIHWIFVYKGERVSIFAVVTYGGTALYVTINALITSSPIRILHVVYPMVMVTMYAVTNFVYQEANLANSGASPKSYPGWRTYKDILSTDLVFVVGAGVVHMYLYTLYVIRLLVARAWCTNNRTFIYWQPLESCNTIRQDVRYTYLTAS
ncbi:hypothetical protein SNE40_013930 [Patella caerulea]|uniref:Uncharacterized protein n=1 Tax=Patella caerulea TaxID=87958 RepID=A0AAN8JCK8_PATCE